MRIVLSLAGLLIVVVTVLQMVKSQLGGVAAVTGLGHGAAPSAKSVPAPQQAADMLIRAVEAGAAGAAQRASEAER